MRTNSSKNVQKFESKKRKFSDVSRKIVQNLDRKTLKFCPNL